MAWKKQHIEDKLQKALKRQFKQSPTDADKYFGYYTSAKDMLISENIFSSIKIIKPDLSDHGEDHIMNVMANASNLLGDKINDLNGIELYFICMLILFHDVGNLTEDREKHHEQEVIRTIYDHIRGSKSDFIEERSILPTVASKHSGTASDGTKDTIKELSLLPGFLFDTQIYTKRSAALLRFADELAEGPHRTSTYMNKFYNFPYSVESKIYHKYAEITKINIDRDNHRICLTYNFKLNAKNSKIEKSSELEFKKLFDFTIKRMLKLEAERKYCKYYCEWLEPFKKTQVTFNFEIVNLNTKTGYRTVKTISPGISEITLDDLNLPISENLKDFHNRFEFCNSKNILSSIKNTK